METILYTFVMLVSRMHQFFLSWNDSIENSFDDKMLHFIIIGALGICMVLVLHPIFLWLSRTGHTMVISFFYVLSAILVLTFAIEIGQVFYGTGRMEFDDVRFGVGGFLVFFAIFIAVRGIIHLIIRATGSSDKNTGRKNDSTYF